MPIGDRDAARFLRDFGLPCVRPDGQPGGNVILDWPEEVDTMLKGLSRPGVVVARPRITYETAAMPGLQNHDLLTINGQQYRVCHAWTVMDGLLSVAELDQA